MVRELGGIHTNDTNIPKDTNGLEAEFTYLKSQLRRHRGLTRKRQENYVNNYWKIKSQKPHYQNPQYMPTNLTGRGLRILNRCLGRGYFASTKF